MSVRYTTESFIAKAREIHGDKYDYSKVVYVASAQKVCIICPDHGEFWQTPNSHLCGKGCRLCGLQQNWSGRRITTESFIREAKKVHGDKYDYSKTVYVSSETKVCVTCIVHGDFFILPRSHITGTQCDKCADTANGLKRRIGKDRFIERARNIHGDKYDYSLIEYITTEHKVKIICPKHGVFEQTPAHHVGRGDGCPMCKKENWGQSKIWPTEKFIEEARKTHGDKYDYSKAVYVRAKLPLTIICPEHGEFQQIAWEHMNGQGCPVCGRLKADEGRKNTLEEFIERSIAIHRSKYDYSESEYVTNKTPLRIICPKHGAFYQTPREHLQGCGCPKCSESTLEKEVRRYLDDHNIPYEYEKRFTWLGRMSLDFYFPQHNIALECQGIQHYEAHDGYMGGEKGLKARQARDLKKRALCEQNGIKLYYYDRSKYKTFFDVKVFKTIESFLEESGIVGAGARDD